MKIKIITSYKPGTWETFAKRGIHSMAEQFPDNVDIVLYCEEPKPKDVHSRIKCVDLIQAEPKLFEFKNKYKNDPVANGKPHQYPTEAGDQTRSKAWTKTTNLSYGTPFDFQIRSSVL